jgi:hypothetical protein
MSGSRTSSLDVDAGTEDWEAGKEQDASTSATSSMITKHVDGICVFLFEVNPLFIVWPSIQTWRVCKTCQVSELELFPADAPNGYTNEDYTPQYRGDDWQHSGQLCTQCQVSSQRCVTYTR